MVVVRHRRRGLFWRVLFRLRVEGADRVPSSGPTIVAGNHVSALDGVVLALTTSSRSRRMTRFLVAAEFSASSDAAVAICEETDGLDAQGDVYADVAEVLELAGRAEEAAEALEQALARYERKGNVVMAARTRSRLTSREAKP